MTKRSLVKKLKAYLLKQEKEISKDYDYTADPGWLDRRLDKIKAIGPNMTDVASYCADDGWDQDAFCSLLYKVAYGEEWDIGAVWENW